MGWDGMGWDGCAHQHHESHREGEGGMDTREQISHTTRDIDSLLVSPLTTVPDPVTATQCPDSSSMLVREWTWYPLMRGMQRPLIGSHRKHQFRLIPHRRPGSAALSSSSDSLTVLWAC